MEMPVIEEVYLDLLTLFCVFLGVAVARSNLRYARDGLPKPLRQYLAVKGVIALFVAVVYGLTALHIFDPSPPSMLSRSVMALLIFLMFLDTLVRDADAYRTTKDLASKLQEMAADAEKAPAIELAPQSNAEVARSA